MSVTALTSKGSRVAFNQEGGSIHLPSGKELKFYRRGGMYILDV